MKEPKYMSNKRLELFKTKIGSHMWKMEHVQSDDDFGIGYLMNSREYLLGRGIKGKQTQNGNTDTTYYELGNIISQLKKGNVNYLWLILSPIIISQYHNCLNELREIVSTNFSKNSYFSINGLAKHNIYHFLECADKKTRLYEKKLNVIGRTLLFGINLFTWHKAMFKATNITNIKEIYELKEQLDKSYINSTLPEKPNLKPFDNYLIKYRILGLKKDNLI